MKTTTRALSVRGSMNSGGLLAAPSRTPLPVVHLGGITRAAGKHSCAGFIEVSIGALQVR
jgi:hypothetical protein